MPRFQKVVTTVSWVTVVGVGIVVLRPFFVSFGPTMTAMVNPTGGQGPLVKHGGPSLSDAVDKHLEIDWYLANGLILGGIAGGVFCYYHRQRHTSDELLIRCVLFLMAGCAVTGAVKVCVMAVAPPREFGDYDRGVIFLGGFAVIWLSVVETVKFFLHQPEKPPVPPVPTVT